MALEESEGHPGPECRGSRGSRATDERGSIRVLPGFQHPCQPMGRGSVKPGDVALYLLVTATHRTKLSECTEIQNIHICF